MFGFCFSTECSTSSSCVSRSRGHLPVQMVLPQVQTHRSSHSPPTPGVVTSGPAVALSPPAHSKPLRQMSGLALGMNGQLYPVGHHQYHGLHPGLLDLKVSSTPGIEDFEPTPSGDSSHSMSSFTTAAPEHRAYRGRIHDSAGLAIKASSETGPAVFVSDTDPTAVAVERDRSASHGPGLAQLTTSHAQIRSSAQLPGKAATSSNLQRNQIITSEPIGPEGFSHATSVRDTTSLSSTITDTSRECHPGSSSVLSTGSNCSDGIVGVTSPYHVTTSSALTMSDAELDQEFQQHLLEFKALEKLAERKAREQMQVAIMRKRKAEMLRVMEIKKARREMMLKGQQMGLGPQNQMVSIDNRATSLGDGTNCSISMNRQKEASVYQARHFGSLLSSSAASAGPLSGKYDESTTRHYVPYHIASKEHYPTNRPQAAANLSKSGKESLPSSRTANQDLGVERATPSQKGASGHNGMDLVPLNLSAEKGNSSRLPSSLSGHSLQATGSPRHCSETIATSSQVLTVSQSGLSIPTTATNTLTTVTTATTSSVVVTSSPSTTNPISTSSQSVTNAQNMATASSPPSMSTNSNSSFSESSASALASTATVPAVQTTTTSSVSIPSSVQCNANISTHSSNNLDIPDSTSTTQAQSKSVDISVTSSATFSRSSTACATKSLTQVPAADITPENSASLPATTVSYTLKLKKEILEDDSSFSETAPVESSSTDGKTITSTNSSFQENSECTASAEVKMEIIEEAEDTSPHGGSVTESKSNGPGESEKHDKPIESSDTPEAAMEIKTVSAGSRAGGKESCPGKREEKISCMSESQDKINGDAPGQEDIALVCKDEMKVEIVEDTEENECPEPGAITCSEIGRHKEIPDLCDAVVKTDDALSPFEAAKDDPRNAAPTEMSHHTDLSVVQSTDDKSASPGEISIRSTSASCLAEVHTTISRTGENNQTVTSASSQNALILKSETEVEGVEKSLIPVAGSPDRSETPATAHQAPTDTAALVDFDPDFPGEVGSATRLATGAYHRRDVAVLEPPFIVSAENRRKSSTGSSPLPAHNQRPFQAAGSLIVPGSASNTNVSPATSPSYKLPRSNSGVSTAVSSGHSNALATPLNYVSSTRVPYPDYAIVSKNAASNLREKDLKEAPPIARRTSLDLTEPITHHKAQTGPGEDQEVDMRYRSFPQPKSSVPQSYCDQNLMRLTSVVMSFPLQEHTAHLATSMQSQNRMATPQAVSQGNRSYGNNPLRPDLIPSATPEEAKTGVGSKRSAFKTLARKRSRDTSALDLSVDNGHSMKGAYPLGQAYSSDQNIPRPSAPSYQEGPTTDSISFQENLHQQGRQSDPVPHARIPYPNGHPMLVGSSPAFLPMAPSSTIPHKHPAEIPSGSSKRLSGSFDKDRARPGGFLTIRPRNLTRDSVMNTTGMHLFTTDTDGMASGNVSSMPKLQEHVRPSISSVAQHRLRYQRPEGNIPVGGQLSGPPVSLSEASHSARMIYSHEYARGFGYDPQRDADANASSKIPAPRPGDLTYEGVQHGMQNFSSQPQGYPPHLAPSETIPEKRQKRTHPELETTMARLGPAAIGGQPGASFQRQSEIMLNSKQDQQHQHMASVSTGYLVPGPPPPQGIFPTPYMLSSKQGLSPGAQYPNSGTVGPEQGEVRRGGVPPVRPPPDLKFQPQAVQDSYMKRSYLHYQQQLQSQQQPQLEQEKQRRQQHEQHQQQQQQQHQQQQQQQQQQHLGPAESGLVRPIPHSKQNYGPLEGGHMGLPSLEVKWPNRIL